MTAASRSADIAARAQQVIPGGVSSSLRFTDPPLVFTRAVGSRVWDADGREYVDFHSAFGPIILGHADSRVRELAMETARELDVVGLGSAELEVRLAEKIREHVPSAEKVLFSNSGSEATYHAIRVSRVATGRPLVVKFQGCYHGWHDYTGANVISPPEKVGTIDPISAGTLPQAMDWLVVLPFNDIEAIETLMRTRGHEVAAVILEPIVHTIGCVIPTQEWLDALRRTTREHGSILIFDEVVTGFRHHLGGYQAICGIRPDLSTFAKAMANGYPVAALAGRADIMDLFNTRPGAPVMFGGTYNGHPMSMAAALATIEILEADDAAIHRHLFRLGEIARSGLQEICDRVGLTARATAFGSVFVVYFTDREVRSFDDALTSDAELYVGFHRAMIDRGFLMLPLNLKRNSLTAAHSDEDIARFLQAAEDVLGEFALKRARPASARPAISAPAAATPAAGS